MAVVIIAVAVSIAKSSKKDEDIPEAECSKCGKTPIYIASPDHCYECFEKYEWHNIDKLTPPHKVVLAAWYTYDCGWNIHTAWWDKDKKCWMDLGENMTKSSGREYSHWRLLPHEPVDSKFVKQQEESWRS
jgi:hypothetical protein